LRFLGAGALAAAFLGAAFLAAVFFVDLVAIGIGFEVNPHRLLKKYALRQQEFEMEAATSKNFFICQIGVFPTENSTFGRKFYL
jgi:hypothetical protein